MTNKRYVPIPPPLTVGILPDTGEEVAYPTPEPDRGGQGKGGGTSRKTVREMIRRNQCCPPIVGSWALQLVDLLPPLVIPAPGTGLRLVLQPVTGAIPPDTIQSFDLSVGKMQDPNSTTAKVELLPSLFNFGSFPSLDSVVFTAVPEDPVFDLLRVNIDTFGAEVSILDLVLTNICGCCTVVPVEMVEVGP